MHSLKHHQVKSYTCSTVNYAQTWLTANWFGQFLSLFANYMCQDLLRLSRRDPVDLCGAADGIRLYNAFRFHTVKVVLHCHGNGEMYDKPCLIDIHKSKNIHTNTHTHTVCQAICLKYLTAQELCGKVAEKLNIPPQAISSLLRLTSSGILVPVDDTVRVINMLHEFCSCFFDHTQECAMFVLCCLVTKVSSQWRGGGVYRAKQWVGWQPSKMGILNH